jgi:glyoxylase-like metal-dependent hydrolase (beta-lactamase superfamily II)
LSLSLPGLRLHSLDGGRILLDGGAMFGVVPKTLWERRLPADRKNRIEFGLRCLLVETADELVLIETGVGSKEGERFRDIYGIRNDAPEDSAGADRVEAAIHSLGFSAGDVGVVINTHLHFDHAGGNTVRGVDGAVRLTYPNARYYVQRGEWEYAHRTNERTRASYLPDNYQLLHAAGRLELLDGDAEVVPGISVVRTPGHTPHHQSVMIGTGDEKACFIGDLLPTFTHLPLPWIMAYDVEPLLSLETKRELLRTAALERWLLVSPHDPALPWAYAVPDGKEVALEEVEQA